ncbi:MAG: acyl carrier protein [Flavobacteriales bacterium]
MDVNDIIAQYQEIFKDVLDNDDVVLKYETTAADVEDWDSLSHIQIVVAIEKHFKVKFTTAEIREFKNVGEMCEATLKKLS